jgi:Uma2 family endonuclease
VSVIIARSPSSPQPADTGVRPRRWTREEYYRAAELGLFRPEERLELLDGEILEKMSPQKERHTVAVLIAGRVLARVFGPNYHVRPQMPLVLDDQSETEPDVLVVPGVEEAFLERHPTAADVRLLVEVSDTTLRLDRGDKRTAYARAGVPEYWVLDLRKRRLEVCRDPAGSRYRSMTILGEEDVVTPLAVPDRQIRVTEMLPPRR